MKPLLFKDFKIDTSEKEQIFIRYYRYLSSEFSWNEKMLIEEAKKLACNQLNTISSLHDYELKLCII